MNVLWVELKDIILCNFLLQFLKSVINLLTSHKHISHLFEIKGILISFFLKHSIYHLFYIKKNDVMDDYIFI